MTQRSALLLMFVVTLGMAHPAHARTRVQPTVDQIVAACANYGDGSTSEQSACVYREVEREKVRLAKSYATFVSNDLKMVGGDYGRYDPRREIAEAQRAWRRWMLQECGVRADLTRGSAGATFLPACELKLTRERRIELDRLARFPGTTY